VSDSDAALPKLLWYFLLASYYQILKVKFLSFRIRVDSFYHFFQL